MGILKTLLSGIGSRSSMESGSFNINSPEAWDALGATKSLTGLAVNHNVAMTYSPWWRGVNLIARDVGKLPCVIYRRKGEGKERATDHPAYRLMRYQSNEWQTANVFRSTLTGHAVSKGNGYAFIERDNGGSPLGMYPLDPDQTYPVRENGRLWYVWHDGTGTPKKFDYSEVLHVHGLGYDGLCGYSVVDMARDAIGLGKGQETQQTVAIKNGARPGIILEVPGTVKPEQVVRLRETWDSVHSGPEKAGKTMILENGLTAKAVSFSAEQQQLIESRQFQVKEIANFLGMPAHKLGDGSRTAYASLEQENQSYLDDTLDFWLCVWEMECWSKLFTEAEKDADSHVIEFMRQALVRADMTTRASYYRTSLGGHPWETPNEVRARENLNPIEGGDTVPVPLNMGNSGGADNQPEDPSQTNVKPKRLDGVHQVLADARRRALRRITTHAEKAAKTPREFGQWLDRLQSEHGEAVRAILSPAYRAWHDAHESEADPVAIADTWLDETRAALLELSGGSTMKTLAASVAAWAAKEEASYGN